MIYRYNSKSIVIFSSTLPLTLFFSVSLQLSSIYDSVNIKEIIIKPNNTLIWIMQLSGNVLIQCIYFLLQCLYIPKQQKVYLISLQQMWWHWHVLKSSVMDLFLCSKISSHWRTKPDINNFRREEREILERTFHMLE